MGYIKHLLQECYMLYKCLINLNCQFIIYQLGINFINMYFEQHFISFNKIMLILALLWINWIRILVTGLKSLKPLVTTN